MNQALFRGSVVDELLFQIRLAPKGTRAASVVEVRSVLQSTFFLISFYPWYR